MIKIDIANLDRNLIAEIAPDITDEQFELANGPLGKGEASAIRAACKGYEAFEAHYDGATVSNQC